MFVYADECDIHCQKWRRSLGDDGKPGLWREAAFKREECCGARLAEKCEEVHSIMSDGYQMMDAFMLNMILVRLACGDTR